MSTVVIYNKRWYYRVKKDDSIETSKIKTKALMEDINQKQLETKFVVCYVTPNNVKLFTYFDNYTDFGLYSVKFSVEKWSFYECIFGAIAQKLHFDIDIAIDDEQEKLPTGYDLDTFSLLLRNETIMASVETLQQLGVVVNHNKDLLLYSSHGAKKRSYHFVINNYCVASNEEAKEFYEKVIQKINAKYPIFPNKQLKKWIDHAVYSSFQQFRIVGSQKYQSKRPKKLEKRWLFFDKEIEHEYVEKPDSIEHEFMLQLEESLVSLTNNCNLLPSLLGDKPTKVRYSHGEMDNVSVDVAKKALESYAKACNVSVNDSNFPYRIMKIQGGLVMLKRVKPSKCRVCEKIHEHENPYLILVKKDDGIDVFFNCRRSEVNQPGGHIGPEASVPLPMEVGQIHSIDEKGFPMLNGDDEKDDKEENGEKLPVIPMENVTAETNEPMENKSVLERMNEINIKMMTSDNTCSVKEPISRITVPPDEARKLREKSTSHWTQPTYIKLF